MASCYAFGKEGVYFIPIPIHGRIKPIPKTLEEIKQADIKKRRLAKAELKREKKNKKGQR